MLKTTNPMLVPNSRNVEGGGLAVQGQNYSHAVNYSGPGILAKNMVDTRNMIKHHKPSNSLGNAQVVNRIMYPITQINTNAGNSNYNSHHGSVNSSQQNSSRQYLNKQKRPSKNRRVVVGGAPGTNPRMKSNDNVIQEKTDPDYTTNMTQHTQPNTQLIGNSKALNSFHIVNNS